MGSTADVTVRLPLQALVSIVTETSSIRLMTVFSSPGTVPAPGAGDSVVVAHPSNAPAQAAAAAGAIAEDTRFVIHAAVKRCKVIVLAIDLRVAAIGTRSRFGSRTILRWHAAAKQMGISPRCFHQRAR